MADVVVRSLSVPWLGTVVGIIGALSGFFFYWKSRRVTSLAYQIQEFSVVGGRSSKFPTELKISFNGEDVPRVTSSKIIIWNAGRETIHGSAIADADPVRICVSKGTILKIDLTKVTRGVNQFDLRPYSETNVCSVVQFDFLDPGDGCVATVLHSSSLGKLSLIGTVKGIKEFKKISGSSMPEASKLNARVFKKNVLVMSAVVGLFGIVVGLFAEYLVNSLRAYGLTEEVQKGVYWPFVVVGAMYTLMPAFLLWSFRRRYPADLAERPTEEIDESQSLFGRDRELD